MNPEDVRALGEGYTCKDIDCDGHDFLTDTEQAILCHPVFDLVERSQRRRRALVTFEKRESVREVAHSIYQAGVTAAGHIVDGQLQGIFTVADLCALASDKDSNLDDRATRKMSKPVDVVLITDTLIEVLNLMDEGGHRHVGVIDHQNRALAILSMEEVLHQLLSVHKRSIHQLREDENLYQDLYGISVGRVVDEMGKRRAIKTVAEKAKVFPLARFMAKQRIGAVLSIDEDSNSINGILTEWDVLRLIAQGGNPAKANAWDIMSRDPFKIYRQESLFNALAVMQAAKVRHLAVYSGRSRPAILSQEDIINHFISNFEGAVRGTAPARKFDSQERTS